MQKYKKKANRQKKTEKKRPLHNNLPPSVLFTCFGPVVQLNRTSDSGSESRGFESRRGHRQQKVEVIGLPPFMEHPLV